MFLFCVTYLQYNFEKTIVYSRRVIFILVIYSIILYKSQVMESRNTKMFILFCFNYLQYNFDKTIVDSGTTNLRFPVKVFNAIVTQIRDSLLVSIAC